MFLLYSGKSRLDFTVMIVSDIVLSNNSIFSNWIWPSGKITDHFSVYAFLTIYLFTSLLDSKQIQNKTIILYFYSIQ